jgi:glyoxylase-like metal-dependent hydrolase (beta-lactamase superfamily II)
MHRWSVGDIDVVRVEDSAFALPTSDALPEWMVPAFAPSRNEVSLAFSALAVRVGDTRIVVDPWLADDGPRGRRGAAEHAARVFAELAAAGFAPDDVDLVVNSHFDGVGWNTRPSAAGGWEPTFPNARYLYVDAELAAMRRGDVIGGEPIGDVTLLDPLLAAGLLDEIALPHSLVPGVELVDAPGHNPGHAAVRLADGGDLAVIPGHLVLSPWQVHDPAVNLGDTDPALATATRRAILGELADRGGLLLTTLVGGPGGGRVHRRTDGDGFRLEA